MPHIVYTQVQFKETLVCRNVTTFQSSDSRAGKRTCRNVQLSGFEPR